MFSKALSIVLASLLIVGAAHAQAAERPVQLASAVQLVVPADASAGTAETLVDAASVVPQDQLVFSVSYRNTSGEPVTDLLIVNAVPPSVRISEESAAATEVSVDGGTSWGQLGTLVVAQADGTTVPATIEDISHLRWKVSLIGPGQSGAVSFRATVR